MMRLVCCVKESPGVNLPHRAAESQRPEPHFVDYCIAQFSPPVVCNGSWMRNNKEKVFCSKKTAPDTVWLTGWCRLT